MAVLRRQRHQVFSLLLSMLLLPALLLTGPSSSNTVVGVAAAAADTTTTTEDGSILEEPHTDWINMTIHPSRSHITYFQHILLTERTIDLGQLVFQTLDDDENDEENSSNGDDISGSDTIPMVVSSMVRVIRFSEQTEEFERERPLVLLFWNIFLGGGPRFHVFSLSHTH
jgi:hypothetical protein